MCRSRTGINIGEGFFQIVGEQGRVSVLKMAGE